MGGLGGNGEDGGDGAPVSFDRGQVGGGSGGGGGAGGHSGGGHDAFNTEGIVVVSGGDGYRKQTRFTICTPAMASNRWRCRRWGRQWRWRRGWIECDHDKPMERAVMAGPEDREAAPCQVEVAATLFGISVDGPVHL